MIHFNFTVSDSDAEIILDSIEHVINDNKCKILNLMKDPLDRDEDIDTLKERNEYLLMLIDRMHFNEVIGD